MSGVEQCAVVIHMFLLKLIFRLVFSCVRGVFKFVTQKGLKPGKNVMLLEPSETSYSQLDGF